MLRGFESHPFRQNFADVAQLVVQLIRNQQVVGSSPTISSNICVDGEKIILRDNRGKHVCPISRFNLDVRFIYRFESYSTHQPGEPQQPRYLNSRPNGLKRLEKQLGMFL